MAPSRRYNQANHPPSRRCEPLLHQFAEASKIPTAAYAFQVGFSEISPSYPTDPCAHSRVG